MVLIPGAVQQPEEFLHAGFADAVRARKLSLDLAFGYGRDDRFAQGHQLMAQAFDARRVDVIDGKHDWATWRTLWNNFIERSAPYVERIASEARA